MTKMLFGIVVAACWMGLAQVQDIAYELVLPSHQFSEGLKDVSKTGEAFGIAVALSGDGKTAAISLVPTNLVYLYHHSNAGWQLTDKSGSNLEGGGFGDSLVLDAAGTTLFVGEFAGLTEKGATGRVHVYINTDGEWKKGQVIEAKSGLDVSNFGYSLALSGDEKTLIVAAPNTDKGSGAVFVYDLIDKIWTQTSLLVQENAPLFGVAVALDDSGDVGLIGASSNSNGEQAIPVFVYRRNPETHQWSVEAKLLDAEAEPRSLFGNTVALSRDGTVAVVSARGQAGDQGNDGVVYLFKKLGQGWQELPSLIAPEGVHGFGATLGLRQDDTLLLVSSYGTSNIYGYRLLPNVAVPVYELEISKGQDYHAFGDPLAVASQAGSVLVGLPGYYGAGNLPTLLFKLPTLNP